VPSYAAQIARFEAGLASPVLEVGDLSTRRDFMDVRDVVDAYAELIAASDRLERVCLYNLCSGQARTSESLLSELGALSRVPFEIKVARDHLRASEIPSACGDASAIAARIHWRPRRSLRDTLGAVLDHARAGLDMARTRDQR
jgi:GDP-4-dehydro-6-deoxy-D-mannose reductase